MSRYDQSISILGVIFTYSCNQNSLIKTYEVHWSRILKFGTNKNFNTQIMVKSAERR